ncbi:hypothetical protein [Lysobacter enzymogenes]|uniref:hypothetical protein n=1 Tax=Lysobacter enzymogenes TaxID=69 RepID=UPI00099D513F|nr:hypothetical protein [Lysobacter enzymogenes]UZW62885.1 hypothetical protein BV903_011605 [Lysobacter enzymogenes]
MRPTRLFALIVFVGVVMIVCALHATVGVVVLVSGGGYTSTPFRDFAIEHFWLWGPALVAVGTLGWIAARLWPRSPAAGAQAESAAPTNPRSGDEPPAP